MKKLMFLTMIFGLMMVLSGSVSAQKASPELSMAVGAGEGTPAPGEQLLFRIHTRSNDEPNAPAGTKYLTFVFSQKGKLSVSALMQLTPAQVQWLGGAVASDKLTITRVEKPLPIKKYDGLKLTVFNNNFAFIQVEVIQSGKRSLGKMKIYLKKA